MLRVGRSVIGAALPFRNCAFRLSSSQLKADASVGDARENRTGFRKYALFRLAPDRTRAGLGIWAAANQSRRVFSEMRAPDNRVVIGWRGNGRNKGAESLPRRAFSELGAVGLVAAYLRRRRATSSRWPARWSTLRPHEAECSNATFGHPHLKSRLSEIPKSGNPESIIFEAAYVRPGCHPR